MPKLHPIPVLDAILTTLKIHKKSQNDFQIFLYAISLSGEVDPSKKIYLSERSCMSLKSNKKISTQRFSKSCFICMSFLYMLNRQQVLRKKISLLSYGYMKVVYIFNINLLSCDLLIINRIYQLSSSAL